MHSGAQAIHYAYVRGWVIIGRLEVKLQPQLCPNHTSQNVLGFLCLSCVH